MKEHVTLITKEAVSREVLSLPMYPELDDEQAKYVIQAICNFYAR